MSGFQKAFSRNGQYSATENAFELTFNDIANVPVADASSLLDWNVFFNLPTNGEEFTSVVVDNNTVKLYGGSGITIADYRFQTNVNLISIDDKAGCIIAIGYHSFFQCTAAASFKFKACVTVGEEAFYYCSSATIEMENLETAASKSFYGMSAAPQFSFEKLTTVPAQCFMNCAAATGFNFPLATSAGAQAFRGCTGSASFSLPACTTLGNYCFYGCNQDASYDLSSVATMGDTVASNNVFNSISGKTITLTVKSSLLTCNSGNPDGDIQTLQAANTVTIIPV